MTRGEPSTPHERPSRPARSGLRRIRVARRTCIVSMADTDLAKRQAAHLRDALRPHGIELCSPALAAPLPPRARSAAMVVLAPPKGAIGPQLTKEVEEAIRAGLPTIAFPADHRSDLAPWKARSGVSWIGTGSSEEERLQELVDWLHALPCDTSWRWQRAAVTALTLAALTAVPVLVAAAARQTPAATSPRSEPSVQSRPASLDEPATLGRVELVALAQPCMFGELLDARLVVDPDPRAGAAGVQSGGLVVTCELRANGRTRVVEIADAAALSAAVDAAAREWATSPVHLRLGVVRPGAELPSAEVASFTVGFPLPAGLQWTPGTEPIAARDPVDGRYRSELRREADGRPVQVRLSEDRTAWIFIDRTLITNRCYFGSPPGLEVALRQQAITGQDLLPRHLRRFSRADERADSTVHMTTAEELREEFVAGPWVSGSSPPEWTGLDAGFAVLEPGRVVRDPPRDGLPATGLCPLEAVAYGSWLTETTRSAWRLPSPEELSAAPLDRHFATGAATHELAMHDNGFVRVPGAEPIDALERRRDTGCRFVVVVPAEGR